MGKIDNLLKFIISQDPVKIAIGISLGIVFTQLSVSIISDIVNPIVNIITKLILKNGLKFKINDSEFNFNGVIEKLITFIIFTIIIYYIIIIPIVKLKDKYNINTESSQCPYCKTLINRNSSRCSACTSQLISNWSQNLISF